MGYASFSFFVVNVFIKHTYTYSKYSIFFASVVCNNNWYMYDFTCT